MKRHLFLVSSGLSPRGAYDFLRSIVEGRYRSAQVVTTAHPKKEKAPWAIVAKEQLEEMGLKTSFTDFDAGEHIADDTEVVYVCGGNTFHLLKSVQDSAWDIHGELEHLFERDGLYIGTSAGAVICSPSIAIAGEVGGDKNIDEVQDMKGFGFVQKHIAPHYRSTADAIIDTFLSKYSLSQGDIVKLSDGSGWYISDTENQVLHF